MASHNHIKRGKTYDLQWYNGGQLLQQSLRTPSYQLAGELPSRFEVELVGRGEHRGPTRTPVGLGAAFV